MDCHEAQAQFEWMTLGAEPAGGLDRSAVRSHLAECPACRRLWEAHHQFEAQVGRLMSDVPVPAGLQDRLRAAVESCPAPAETGSSQRWPRRLVWTALALVPLIVWGVLSRPTSFNESAVSVIAGLDLNTLPVSGAVQSPGSWRSLRAVQWGAGTHMARVQGVQVPVVPFVARLDRRTPHAAGVLVQLTPAQWHASSLAPSFAAATIQYAPFGTWAVWRENDSVYLCILHDNAHVMQRLQEIVGHAAFASA